MCSSDRVENHEGQGLDVLGRAEAGAELREDVEHHVGQGLLKAEGVTLRIGRASCRERG